MIDIEAMIPLPCSVRGIISIALLISIALVVSIQAAALDHQDSDQQPLVPYQSEGVPTNGTNLRSDGEADSTGPRPFYMIGHRVLVKQGIYDAIKHGANAVEIDMTADRDGGWWADHDNVPGSRGDAARTMFEAIAAARKAGKNITLVWLDLKNPDRCFPYDENLRYCSIFALRDLAREILEPLGIRVQYGFYRDTMMGNAWRIIRNNMTSNEALNVDGKTRDVIKAFENCAPPIQQPQRVMSNGLFHLRTLFGNCNEKDRYTCTELRQAVESRYFGKVFGWTSSKGQADLVDKLLGRAGVDGLIYGKPINMYKDDEECRAAAQDIIRWVQDHPDRAYFATNNDPPW